MKEQKYSLFILLLFILPFLLHAKTIHHTFVIARAFGSVDGVKRDFITVNGVMPGPTIEAECGDRLVIRVINHLASEVTSIHWHGFLHADGYTNAMDGAVGITSRPIEPGSEFVYDFSTDRPMTTFYHSHIGEQRADGLFGAFIIRDRKDPLISHYDEERIIVINEWYHANNIYKFSEPFHPRGGSDFQIESILFNGRAHANCSAPTVHLPCNTTGVPLTEIPVQKGKTYRFRIINAGSRDFYRFGIDEHAGTVVDIQGTRLQPVSGIYWIELTPAMRYDVLYTANDPSDTGAYWMRTELWGIGSWRPFANYTDLYTRGQIAKGRAILRYTDSNTTANPVSDPHPPGSLDIVGNETWEFNDVRMKSYSNVTLPTPIRTIVTNVSMHDDGTVFFRVVSSSNSTPKEWRSGHFRPPLLHHFLKGTFPPKEFPGHIEYVEEGEIVDIVINSIMEHPFHIHGNIVWFLGAGEGFYDPQTAVLNEKTPVIVDTWFSGGKAQCCPPELPKTWSKVRLIASNPGVWVIHCHMDQHQSGGKKWLFVVNPKDPNVLKEFVPVKLCDMEMECPAPPPCKK